MDVPMVGNATEAQPKGSSITPAGTSRLVRWSRRAAGYELLQIPAEVPHLRTLFKIEQVLRRLRQPVRPLIFEGLDSRKRPECKSNHSRGSKKPAGPNRQVLL